MPTALPTTNLFLPELNTTNLSSSSTKPDNLNLNLNLNNNNSTMYSPTRYNNTNNRGDPTTKLSFNPNTANLDNNDHSPNQLNQQQQQQINQQQVNHNRNLSLPDINPNLKQAGHALPFNDSVANQLMDSHQYPYLQPDIMSGLNDMPGLINKANLIFEGNIMEVVSGWSEEEMNNRRRLVQFWRRHENNNIHCTFRAIPPSTKPPNSTVISCIYWDAKQEYFVTSVDCIQLLESLISVRFTVEEKNRIRRNLEGFRPLTVSKCKQDTADFFKLIMAFPNPKPRNIEKDVKVFPWKVLTYALKKIVSKYATGLSQGLGSSIPSFNHSSEIKYEPPSSFNPYSAGSSSYQHGSYQRRYSQPTNMLPMNMYPQPEYFNYNNKGDTQSFTNPTGMPAIPERATMDDLSRTNHLQQSLLAQQQQQNAFVRRHSMADPYSMQRLHHRPSDPTSLAPPVEEEEYSQSTNNPNHPSYPLYRLGETQPPSGLGNGMANDPTSSVYHNDQSLPSSSRHY